MKPIDRRSFLQLAGAAGAAGLIRVPGIPSGLRVAHAAETAAAGSIIHGKSAGMIVHNAKLGVMETPLDALRTPHFTPKEILYNRTHFPVDGAGAWVATTDAAPKEMIDQWTIATHPARRR
jgi:hypothetical protein